MTAYGYLGGDPSKLDVDGYIQGDLPAANASGVLVPVPIGTAGNVLTVNAGQPELLDYEPGGGGGGGVNSVFTRAGNVVAQAGDYTAVQVGADASGAAAAVLATSVQKAQNLADLANVVTARTNLGLGNVDNTSDANKPVSTAQQTALNLKANVASPTFTGTATFARQVNTPVVLADAATILVNASLGNTFRMTLTTTGRTLGNPSSAVDGQMLLFEIIQSAAGSLTLNLDTKFAFGTGITSFTMTATANKRDFLGCFYNSTADKFFIIALAQGY